MPGLRDDNILVVLDERLCCQSFRNELQRHAAWNAGFGCLRRELSEVPIGKLAVEQQFRYFRDQLVCRLPSCRGFRMANSNLDVGVARSLILARPG
jgi:hypothetical protein